MPILALRPYWLRWASSAITMMLRRSERVGKASPRSSGRNFWIVVKTTPPAARSPSFWRSSARAVDLLGHLPQQARAAAEGAEQLIVQVVAVGQDHQRRVAQFRLHDQLPGEEHHGQALAAALGVPHHAAPAVPAQTAGLHGGPHGALHRVELVVGRHLLDDLRPLLLEHHEVPDQVCERCWREGPTDQRLQTLGQHLAARDGLPRLEALEGRARDPQSGMDAVRDDQQRVVSEQPRELLVVGLQLRVRLLDGGAGVLGVLELEDHQRQPIDEHDHVRPPLDRASPPP